MWQMCQNALPVKGNLLRRGCNTEPQCPLCLEDIEKTDHLVGDCPCTQKVWELAAIHQWIPTQIHSILHVIG